MKNKFALSFGISLIIVGVLNGFFDTSQIILFGLSFSTLIFSLISMFLSRYVDISNSKLELLYIIPFVVLLSIFCYSVELEKIKVINYIVNGKLVNILTFISFGCLFFSEYLNFRLGVLQERLLNMSIIDELYNYSVLILDIIRRYKEELLKKKVAVDPVTDKYTEEIKILCDEKVKRGEIEIALLDLKKDTYTLEDFDKAYVEKNKKLNYEFPFKEDK